MRLCSCCFRIPPLLHLRCNDQPVSSRLQEHNDNGKHVKLLPASDSIPENAAHPLAQRPSDAVTSDAVTSK